MVIAILAVSVFAETADIFFFFSVVVRVAQNLIVRVFGKSADKNLFLFFFFKTAFVVFVFENLQFSADKVIVLVIAVFVVSVKNDLLFFTDELSFGFIAVFRMNVSSFFARLFF